MAEIRNHSNRITITVFSKPECHLCDEAKEALIDAKQYFDFEIKEINIEDNREHFEKYQFDIPVIWINDRKAFKHKIDLVQLKRRLEKEQSAISRDYS